METKEILLASASPRRSELFSQMGLPFRVAVADVTEITAGAPDVQTTENARLKAHAVLRENPDAVVLAADTLVCVHDEVLGKPRDAEDAMRMLALLSGGWHTVYTGVCVLSADGEQVACETTRVQFVPLSPKSIRRYVDSGEPMDKAGAYAVQGQAGMFVSGIEGSYSNVIGLPMSRTRDMLMALGYAL